MSITVYRVGDLDKYKRKADSMYQMFGRSTGYFGTGYYFCTKPENCCTITRENDPLEISNANAPVKFVTVADKLEDIIQIIGYKNIEKKSKNRHGKSSFD